MMAYPGHGTVIPDRSASFGNYPAAAMVMESNRLAEDLKYFTLGYADNWNEDYTADLPPNQALKMISEYVTQGTRRDIIIRCGDIALHCHRVILCAQVPFFKAACDGNFKEAKDGVINLPEDDPEVVKHMIDYLYTRSYLGIHLCPHRNNMAMYCQCYPPDAPGLDSSHLLAHLQVRNIADKYDIKGLKQLSEFMFKMAFRELPVSHDCLLSEEVVSAVKMAYEDSTAEDRSLRGFIVHVFHQLKLKPSYTVLIDLFREVPELAFELLCYHQPLSR